MFRSSRYSELEMSEEYKLRKELCKIGKRLYERHLTSGARGNISVRTSKNEVLIKPSGFSLADMKPEHVVKLNLEGEVLEDFARIVLIAKILSEPLLLPEEEVHKLRTLESEKWRMKFVEELYK